MPLDPKTRYEMERQLEALKKVMEYELAFENRDVDGMIEAARLPSYLLKDMDEQDIADAINVRMADAMREAGLVPIRREEKE